jgi:hypothetical protein
MRAAACSTAKVDVIVTALSSGFRIAGGVRVRAVAETKPEVVPPQFAAVTSDYRPLNDGGVFWRNAVVPARKSSVAATRPK